MLSLLDNLIWFCLLCRCYANISNSSRTSLCGYFRGIFFKSHLRTSFLRNTPKANSICERSIGSMRRECLDYMIPINESHLRRILKDWTTYYNQSRPHMALGPNIPDLQNNNPVSLSTDRHRISGKLCVIANTVLGCGTQKFRPGTENGQSNLFNLV